MPQRVPQVPHPRGRDRQRTTRRGVFTTVQAEVELTLTRRQALPRGRLQHLQLRLVMRRTDVLDVARPPPGGVHDLHRPRPPTPSSPSAHTGTPAHPTTPLGAQIRARQRQTPRSTPRGTPNAETWPKSGHLADFHAPGPHPRCIRHCRDDRSAGEPLVPKLSAFLSGRSFVGIEVILALATRLGTPRMRPALPFQGVVVPELKAAVRT